MVSFIVYVLCTYLLLLCFRTGSIMEHACTYADLSAIPWVPLNIGDSKFLAKAWFGDSEYRLLLSDLNNIWEEDINVGRIQSRAKASVYDLFI